MDQIHECENLVADVLSEDMKMCEILQANVLLKKFPPSWNDYRNYLTHKKRDLTLQELISHMRTEEANRLKDKKISNSSFSINANLVEPSKSSKDKFQHKGKKFKKNVQQKSHKENDGKIQKNKCHCYCCGKTGYKAYQCYQRKDQQKTNQKQNTPQLNLAEIEKIIAAVVLEANLVENKMDWILDTGASKHFCANNDLFQEFHEASNGECVFMGNSATAGVMGKGKVLLKLTSGKTLALLNVLYVPSLRGNLISGSLLNKTGLKIVREADKPLLAISKIQSSYARDCHDSSSQRTNSRTIRTGNPSHTDQALRSFHMAIPVSHFNQLNILPTNPLKLHRRPMFPADETRLQYLMQVSIGSSMPNLEVLDLERSRPTLRSWFHSCQTYAQPNSTG
ncbi:UNVERIFIED_CONTAM: hypothetical protein Sangu_0397900 [Sesamum angustifolium]|uniref:Retrovirus-related Pol polyprotein from transposon TNT 1-94-like beta-barrel domain-containing protein n=1 Tax=Sesamum angustifolium TaxID=2727405 RepID=A0AAW2QSL6_9LAMI